MTAMPVDPQIRQVIDALAASEFGPVHELTPVDARAQYERMVKARGIEPASTGAVEDRTIPGPAGDLPVRIYRPDRDTGALPAFVYYHGGGHVIGNLDTHDAVARNLCNGAGCVVVSVDYRLAPEHKFPAAAEDAFAAVRWCAAHGPEIGVDPGQIAVGGDSAGGNLAAVAALMARDAGGPAIRLQVLVYPVTDYACDTESYRTYAEGYGMLEAQSMRWFRDHYLRGEADRLDWRGRTATRRGSLRCGSGARPHRTVRRAPRRGRGVRATAARGGGWRWSTGDCEGMIHGFFTMAPTIDGAVRAQALVCGALRSAFAQVA